MPQSRYQFGGIRYYYVVASGWERIVRGLGLVTVVAFVIITTTPVSNIVGFRYGIRSDQLKRSDAIVVLGAGLNHGAVLSDQSLQRLIAGIELYRRDMAPILVLSGPSRPDRPVASEAAVRAKLAEAMGIPPGSILKEETAKTTREESIHIADTLRSRHATAILLVTDSLHMRRSARVFERAGLDVQPAISADYPCSLVSAGDRLWLAMRVVQESTGLVYYKLAGYI
jgi:uncharacterized SAM-binding protein YcdF (DUF218 family)